MLTAETLPEAMVVRFYPRRGLGYKHEKDHVALTGQARTFCGLEAENFPKSSGTAVSGVVFDPSVPWACKRCRAALAKRGPVRMFSRISFYDNGTWSTVTATREEVQDGER